MLVGRECTLYKRFCVDTRCGAQCSDVCRAIGHYRKRRTPKGRRHMAKRVARQSQFQSKSHSFHISTAKTATMSAGPVSPLSAAGLALIFHLGIRRPCDRPADQASLRTSYSADSRLGLRCWSGSLRGRREDHPSEGQSASRSAAERGCTKGALWSYSSKEWIRSVDQYYCPSHG